MHVALLGRQLLSYHLSAFRERTQHNCAVLLILALPAAVSEKVKEGKAHGLELCGEKLVLFRGKDGKVSQCHCWYHECTKWAALVQSVNCT